MRLNLFRIACSVLAFSLVSGVALSCLGASTVQSSPQASSGQAPSGQVAGNDSDDDSCLSDPAVLSEINKKKADLDQRARDLSAKEAELNARDAAVTDELKKLQGLRDEISGLQAARAKDNADKVAKVVATLEGMSPKSAAQMLTDLDDGLAVAAIAQMNTTKLSKVMNALDPKRAAKLTELLAGVVRANHADGDSAASSDASNGAAVATISQDEKKGGRTNDKQYNKQPESIISGGPEQFAGSGAQTGQSVAGGQ